MNSLIQILTSQTTLLVLSALLGVITVVTALWWSVVTARARRTLAAGRAALEGEAATRETRLAAALQPERAWREAWTQFRAQCVTLPGDILRAKQPPEAFFHSGAFFRHHAMYWFRGLPGTLVGLGLCFTFAGIIAVIFVAATALDSSSDAAAQTEALRQLLGGASLKFGTSLAGVFCSVVYGIFFRRSLSQLEAAIDDFNAQLERHGEVLDAATLLQSNLEESRRHTTSLGAIGDTIAQRVADKMAEANLVFGDAAHRLEKGVETMSTRMVEATATEMERFVTAATAGLDTALKNHLQAISASLDAIRERLDDTRRGFEAVTAQTAAVQFDYRTLSDEIRSRSSEIAEVMIAAQKQVEQHLEGASTAAAEVRQAFTGIAGDVEAVRHLPAAFAEIAGTVRESVGHWQTLGTKFQDAAETAATAAGQTRAAMLALGMQWKEQADRLTELGGQLSATLGATQSQFDSNGFRFAEAAADLRRAAEAATAALKPFEEIGPLASSLSDAARAMEAAAARESAPPFAGAGIRS